MLWVQTDSLVGLFFADLINLVKQLAYSKLQLGKFIFGSNLLIVIGTFTDLYAKMHSLNYDTRHTTVLKV